MLSELKVSWAAPGPQRARSCQGQSRHHGSPPTGRAQQLWQHKAHTAEALSRCTPRTDPEQTAGKQKSKTGAIGILCPRASRAPRTGLEEGQLPGGRPSLRSGDSSPAGPAVAGTPKPHTVPPGLRAGCPSSRACLALRSSPPAGTQEQGPVSRPQPPA